MARQNPYQTNTGIHIEWFTVKRSTIYALILSSLGLFGAGIYGYFQVFVDSEPEAEELHETDNTARFLDLDGNVKVRHSGTYEWVNAAMGTALNRDDTIKTVGGSTARVRLFDGTEYLLKPDSILVILLRKPTRIRKRRPNTLRSSCNLDRSASTRRGATSLARVRTW